MAERDAPLDQELLDRYAGIAAEATEPDGPAAQVRKKRGKTRPLMDHDAISNQMMETIVCQDRLGTSIREPEALSWRLLLLFLSGVAVADRVHGAGRAGAGQAQGHAADHSDARLRELGKSVMTAQNISPRVLHAQHDAGGDLSILPSQAQASNTHTQKKKLRRYISRNLTQYHAQYHVGGQVLIDLTSDSRHVFDALVEYEGAEDPRVPSCRREDDPAELAVRLADYVREIMMEIEIEG